MIPLQRGAKTREQKELGRLFSQLFVLVVAEMDNVGGKRDGGDCVEEMDDAVGRRDGGGEGARKERVAVRLRSDGWLVC